MVQDLVNPVSYFNASTGPNQKVQGNEADASTHDEQSFGAALTRANRSRQEAKTESPKADKPKLGNREPFFPRKPMPTHAEDSAAAASGPAGIQTMKAASVPSGSEYSDEPINGLESDKPWEANASEIDDRKGVVGQSYDGAAVSYPMSRIARESMDEETKDSLEKQGLWNLPTMVMAQPSAQTSAMKDFVSVQSVGAAKSMKSSVPVQKPIAQFMASLENELGVTPDRLVQALQNLPPGQLQMSPEKTMLQVVKQLGLKGSDETKAVELYSKMLVQMEALGGNEKMPMAVPVLGNQKMDEKLAEQSLKGLSTKSELSQSNQSESLNSQKEVTSSQNGGAHKLARDVDGKDINPLAADKGADASQDAGKLERNSNLKGADLKSMSYENMKGQDSKSDLNSNQNGSQQQFSAQSQSHTAVAHEQASVKDQVKFDLKHDLSAEKNAQGLKPAVIDQNPQSTLQPVDSKMAVATPVNGTAASELKAAEATNKHEAIQSIINNAQLLANKGGGEMHMTLKPDHMGEIQLRVAMEGNHVNVQMVTERGEVKKLIEQSVHELRHGLAQHDLSMNKLEVSVGDKSAGGFKQGMPDFGQARDFANQFHQQNARREMVDDLSNLRSNARGGLGMQSSAARAQTAMSASSGSGSRSGRLNVMA